MGSSPLTRGKHRPAASIHGTSRLIPAHAGKTTDGACSVCRHWAHPRSRGENLRLYGLGALNEGSSPLTRGKRPRGRSLYRCPGLIPAHAGKTARMGTTRARPRAHPRSRGENIGDSLAPINTEGSSPLTRGKRSVSSARVIVIGLIPAHAGKTRQANDPVTLSRAHPRSRGENVKRVLVDWVLSGSSPLTRGKPNVRRRIAHPPRLIPAHAGKTRQMRDMRQKCRAHPRSRGENSGRQPGD